MFSPKNWWNIWPDRALQERHAAGVARAVPRVRAVLRIIDQRAEERRRQRIEVGLGLADDVARDELRRVLEHVDEAVQLAQDVVRDVARGARFAVQVDRDVGVLEADFLDERAQRFSDRRIELPAPGVELLVVDRQDEGRGAATAAARTATGRRSWSRRGLPVPSFSIASASARMPRPDAFSERKSSSMMTTGKRNFMQRLPQCQKTTHPVLNR